jgi:hypothetical protein
LGGRILFFPKQGPVQIEGPTVQELDPAVIGLERAERQAALAQPEQVNAHLFLAQLVGRPAVVRGKPAHPIQIDTLGARRQPGRPHVLCHPLAQSCHRGLLSREVRPAAQAHPQSNLVRPASRRLILYGKAVQSNDRLERWPEWSACGIQAREWRTVGTKRLPRQTTECRLQAHRFPHIHFGACRAARSGLPLLRGRQGEELGLACPQGPRRRSRMVEARAKLMALIGARDILTWIAAGAEIDDEPNSRVRQRQVFMPSTA